MHLYVCLAHLNLRMLELNVQTLRPQACRIDVGRFSLTWRPLPVWSNSRTSSERGSSRCSRIDTNRPPWHPSWRLLLSRGWRGCTRRTRSAWTSCWASGWRSEVTPSTAGKTSSGNKFIYLFYLFIYFYPIYWKLSQPLITVKELIQVSEHIFYRYKQWLKWKIWGDGTLLWKAV